jgi:preprotein translocase subunit SecB
MQRKSVKSSNIASVGYDAARNVLEIEFKTGGVFHYAGVSQKQYDSLIASESVGKFFHGHIRGKHECKRAPL